MEKHKGAHFNQGEHQNKVFLLNRTLSISYQKDTKKKPFNADYMGLVL
tara:strand:- start:1731 stop:1874 length:144 start_codon:yes stop_codon:yes gene_type:complete